MIDNPNKTVVYTTQREGKILNAEIKKIHSITGDESNLYKIEPNIASNIDSSMWKVTPFYDGVWQHSFGFRQSQPNSVQDQIDSLINSYKFGRIKRLGRDLWAKNVYSKYISHAKVKTLLRFEKRTIQAAYPCESLIDINPTRIRNHIDFEDYRIETRQSRNGDRDKQSYVIVTFDESAMRWVNKVIVSGRMRVL